MFRENYQAMYDRIAPDPSLVEKTVRRVGQTSGPKARGIRLLRRTAAAAAVFVCVAAAVPVTAAHVPAVYELIYAVSPRTAQFFIPVQKSCEDNGIRMEVAATYIHENTAEIYVTLRDLTGDRVDETTDLYDSYSIHRPFDCSAHCERVDYDGETKTATFRIVIEQWGDRKIEGEKLTFSVGCFLSDKHAYEGVPIELRLGGDLPETMQTEIYGGGGIHFSEYFSSVRDDPATVLVPSEALCEPVEGVAVTGMGYIDGRLHVQTAVPDPLKNDNHGFLFLRDRDGGEILYDYSVSFTEAAQTESRNEVAYNEFVFDIARSEISQYDLYGSFYTSGLCTEGSWRVTFPLVQSAGEES